VTAFRAYVESLPPGTCVPVLREQLLELMGENRPADDEPDLTVAQVAKRFGRQGSTVRGWIAARKLSAYRFEGHELRITRASLAAFEASQRGDVRCLTRIRGPKQRIDLAAYKHDLDSLPQSA
jgi:excisionase family DNA binding protein